VVRGGAANASHLGVLTGISPLVAQPVRLDVPVMIGASFLTPLLSPDGRVGRLDGLLLFAGIMISTIYAIRQSRKETSQVQAEYDEAYGSSQSHPTGLRQVALNAGYVGVGLAVPVFGSRWMVNGAAEMARLFRVSELVIGLTIVTAGTSLPEVAASVIAALRGERDIAVGNVVGSNSFNLLGILGLSSPLAPEGVAVSSPALAFDIPIMIAVAVACLPIHRLQHRLYHLPPPRCNAARCLPIFSGVMGAICPATDDGYADSADGACATLRPAHLDTILTARGRCSA
jgi:cation:H+ antiporter